MRLLTCILLFLSFYVSGQDSNITVTGGAVLTIDGAAPNQADVCADTRTGTDGVQFIFNDDATWCSIATPVTLVSFDVTMMDHEYVMVSWETSSEINNDYFRVYRSYNFDQWEIVSEIKGFGTTTETQYYQIDDGPLYNGMVYYQLEQIDFDGTSELFDIKSVEVVNSSKRIGVFPNPSINLFQVQVANDSEYTLVNIQGEIVQKSSLSPLKNIIDLTRFPQGIYFLNLRVKSGPATRFKLIKTN